MSLSLLRSMFFSTPLLSLATIFMGTLSMLASLVDGSGRSQHWLARVWAKMVLAVCFIRVKVEGLEKLDPNGSYVFVANHASFMDIPAILSRLPFQFRFFAKKGLYRIPFLGTHLKRAGHLPVDRSNVRASLRSMSEGAQYITQRRISVLLFPEGGRTQHHLEEFKEGAAYIAIKAGVPAVPMALVGMRELLPMGGGHIRTGSTVLRIGDPIPTSEMKSADRADLNLRLYHEVARLLGDAERASVS